MIKYISKCLSILLVVFVLFSFECAYADETYSENGFIIEPSKVVSFELLDKCLAQNSSSVKIILFVSRELYQNTVIYDNLKPYDAYIQGQTFLKECEPKSYGLLESSARRGCNHAKILFADCFLPQDHPLKMKGNPTFELEGKNLDSKEQMQRYLKWMNSAAENGSLTAAKDLAYLYREGKYVSKDANHIFKYTKLAAQANDAEYMYRLGTYYAQGLGCQKDSSAAVKWMKQAAHLGSQEASSWLSERQERQTAKTSYQKQARRNTTASSAVTQYKSYSDCSGGDMVWISATGSKYHRYSSCGRMNPSTSYQMPQSQAKAKGYSRCKRCY